jgi:pimeloyl-ACP methyl ester carboxylesterase
MLHGYGGDKAEILGANPLFWDRGCHILSYYARGHGHSSRALLTFGAHERDDLRLVTDWLANRTGLTRSDIGLIGWSYGAATAIQAAPRSPDLAFVIADSSFSSLTDIANVQGERQIGPWVSIFIPGALVMAGLRAGFDPATAAPAASIAEIEAPVLLVHSRTDGYTPVQHSQTIFDDSDQSRTRLIIPDWDAPHARSYEVDPAAYTAMVDAFVDDFAPGFGASREP